MAIDLKAKLQSFRVSDAGNLSVILCIAAVPLVGAAGLAIDTIRIIEAKSMVQDVADGAALAGAATAGTNEKKKKAAEAFVMENLANLYGVTTVPKVSVSGKNVIVEVDTTVEGTLLKPVFMGKSKDDPASTKSVVGAGSNSSSGQSKIELPTVAFTVQSKAYGELGETYTSCIIALNPSMDSAFYNRGTGDFLAKDCMVHSNSSSSKGMTFQGNAKSTAEKFLSAGGWQKIGNSGSITPSPKESAGSVTDPINISVKDPGGTAASVTIKKQDGNVSLAASKYNNVTVQTQGVASFTPGIHYITGTLSLGSQATLNGNGVTLVLLGPNAKIDMNSGATLKLQAPTSGTYAGFAVMGDKSNSTVLTNTIQGGASGYVRGMWYTPRHKFYITGNGDFNSTSTCFPLIADNVEIGGNGSFTTGVGCKSYGFPEFSQLKVTTLATVKLTQ